MLGIMQACLHYAPEDRQTCEQLVRHPYFENRFVETFELELSRAAMKDREECEVLLFVEGFNSLVVGHHIYR